jgi:hypothetical protein
MATLHITSGPDRVVAGALDCRETRWCFRCREHLPHSWEMLRDQSPWYDDRPVCRCSGCSESHTEFPGCECDGPFLPERRLDWMTRGRRAC